MTYGPRSAAAFIVLALSVSACSPEVSPPAEPAAEPPSVTAPRAPAPAAPQIDLAAAQRFAGDGRALEELTFDRTGSTTAQGAVKGDQAPAYAIAAAQGQTLKVTFTPASPNLYFNVSDVADTSGAALHRGEVDGNVATVTADRDMTLVITPFQPRAMARRNETGDYTIVVARE